MTIEQTIQKAIEGGYDNDAGHYLISANKYWVVWKDKNMADYTIATQVYWLDPFFWQSLGKAMGWETQFDEDKGFNHQWLHEWHRFIGHLAGGEDAESFFKKL